MKTAATVHKAYAILLCLVVFFVGSSFPLSAQDLPAGDEDVAERYAAWIQDTIQQGRWDEARAALRRAADFTDVSSDLSYLLALALTNQRESRHEVMQALDQALYLDSWRLVSREEAQLLRAETLIALRLYDEALRELSGVRASFKQAMLTLKTLNHSQHHEFLAHIENAFQVYPHETEPVRIFLNFLANEDAAGRNPQPEHLALIDLVQRRLPALLPRDAELAWMLAPFMHDTAEARRLVSAYRAIHQPVLESLPIALHLGVINEETAIEELFADVHPSLDLALLSNVWDRLRTEASRRRFLLNLSSYSGVITEDADRDGIPETLATYFEGMLTSFTYDADQSLQPFLAVQFEADEPRRASVLLPPEAAEGGRRRAQVQWERYPAVLEVMVDEVRFIPRPFDFHYSPFTFTDIGSGLLFPQFDPLAMPLTRRFLVFSVHRIERASREFHTGTEVIELIEGIPINAIEIVGDRVVAQTEFEQGIPVLQWVDLNFDGRRDTLRRFRIPDDDVELEDLWDYARDIESSVFVDGRSLQVMEQW